MAKIIPRPGCFEVIRNDGTSRKFYFEESADRRKYGTLMTKKAALIAAKTYAGKGHTMEKEE